MSVGQDDGPTRNWRRGLNRLFVLACIAWAALLLVAFPFRETARARELASESRFMSAHYGSGSSESVESKQLQAKLEEQATLSYFYRHEMLANWRGIAIALVTPPAVVYGLAWSVAAVVAWVLRGFRA